MTKLLPAARGTPFPEAPEQDVVEIDNDRIAFDYFKSKGLTDEQAAGIVGNFDVEGFMNPEQQQFGGGPGHGIAQWEEHARWDTYPGDNVVEFAQKAGRSPTSLDTQLDFAWYELTNFGYYGLDALRETTTVEDATRVFQVKFEGPSTPHTEERIAHAQAALAAFGGSRRLMGGEDSVRVGTGQQPAAHVDTPDSGGGMVAEGHPTVFVGKDQLPFARVGDPTKIRDGTIVEGDDTVLLGGEPGSSQSGIDGSGQ